MGGSQDSPPVKARPAIAHSRRSDTLKLYSAKAGNKGVLPGNSCVCRSAPAQAQANAASPGAWCAASQPRNDTVTPCLDLDVSPHPLPSHVDVSKLSS